MQPADGLGKSHSHGAKHDEIWVPSGDAGTLETLEEVEMLGDFNDNTAASNSHGDTTASRQRHSVNSPLSPGQGSP